MAISPSPLYAVLNFYTEKRPCTHARARFILLACTERMAFNPPQSDHSFGGQFLASVIGFSAFFILPGFNRTLYPSTSHINAFTLITISQMQNYKVFAKCIIACYFYIDYQISNPYLAIGVILVPYAMILAQRYYMITYMNRSIATAVISQEIFISWLSICSCIQLTFGKNQTVNFGELYSFILYPLVVWTYLAQNSRYLKNQLKLQIPT